MSAPVVLILGAGARVGQASAQAFQAAGYHVAIASRSLDNLKTNSSGFLELSLDLSKPETIPAVYENVEKTFGAPPSVVIYNGASRTVLDSNDPLSKVELSALTFDHNVNVLSSVIAAKHAVAGFARLPKTASKTYIHTGNLLNVLPKPVVLTFGAGKTAAAHIIAGLTKTYNGKGYRFYYADQRYENGASPLDKIDGEAHGKEYLELAQDKKQRPWEYTFVKGLGYKAFSPEDADNTPWQSLN